jgi:hypothetical protein
MTKTYESRDLYFDGLKLRLHTKTGRILAIVVPDDKWPNMYRVRIGGDISDMANLSRAKDAAISLALAELRRSQDEAA